MRVAVVAVVLLLAGCTAPPVDGPTSDERSALSAALAQVDDVDSVDVQGVVYDDGRESEITVTITVASGELVAATVADVVDVIDESPFEGDTRELRVEVGDSLFSISAPGGEALDPAVAPVFARWLADPRVASVSWVWALEITLVGDGSTDGSLVEAVYGQLMADPIVLERGGFRIEDPGSFSIAANGHEFSENRFGLAREVAALGGVSDCSFTLDTSSDGSMLHKIYCLVGADDDFESTGAAINALLSARGLLESTNVGLQGPSDSTLTNDGTYTFDES